ncbi:aspartyl-phosphate phosphatase Spo0E family protein [Litchfieldia salsa]|uniref:Spo0E like sporulation regulatory protein n=1 Tax=Litchfieldia salsa TaxID=930152 RepID=A0A1H0VKA8_9BACI|nr:aspartyl-phosphate phosphatase Spo0E family protein [Litchfieldia salsa]SDP78741.1 Spo0E like sporulation regulatory protein [Litchfieldia salsa]
MDAKILLYQINHKRIEMITIGIEKGLLSEETIKSSQELDYLLNVYHKHSVTHSHQQT